jgi:xanthosine utilization system XapX-like protein
MDGIIGFSGLIGFWIGYKVFKTKKKVQNNWKRKSKYFDSND